MGNPRSTSILLKDLCADVRIPDRKQRAAKSLLMFLGAKANNDGTSWYGMRTLCDTLMLSRTTLGECTEYLCSLGWLVVEKGSWAKSNRYHLQTEALVSAWETQSKGGTPTDKVVLPPTEGGTAGDNGGTAGDNGGTPTDRGGTAGVPELTNELTIRTEQNPTDQKPTATRPSFSEEKSDSSTLTSTPVKKAVAAVEPISEIGEELSVQDRASQNLLAQQFAAQERARRAVRVDLHVRGDKVPALLFHTDRLPFCRQCGLLTVDYYDNKKKGVVEIGHFCSEDCDEDFTTAQMVQQNDSTLVASEVGA